MHRVCPSSYVLDIRAPANDKALRDIYATYLAHQPDQDLEGLADRLAETVKSIKKANYTFRLSMCLKERVKSGLRQLQGAYADPMTAEVSFESDLSAAISRLTHLGVQDLARMESVLGDDLYYFPAYIRILLAPTSLRNIRKYREQALTEIDPELADEIKHRGFGSILSRIQNGQH